MTYICINKLEGLWANPEYILINVKGRRYKIVRHDGEYSIVTPEDRQVKVKNFSIERDVAVVWAYEELYGWDICEKVNVQSQN
jgi:hypothetical protein